MSDQKNIEFATELTIAWLSNASTRASADDVDTFLRAMSDTISGLTFPGMQGLAPEPSPEPAAAVSVRKSLASRDYIISMIDGRPYRTLKRHLAKNGLTPDEYRARYNLKADYPMVAPGYSQSRRETAKRLGLGRKPIEVAPVASESALAPAEATAPAEQTLQSASKPRARRNASGTQRTTGERAASSPDTSPKQAEPADGSSPKRRARKNVPEARAAAKKHLGG